MYNTDSQHELKAAVTLGLEATEGQTQ